MSEQKSSNSGWLILLVVVGVGVFWYTNPKRFEEIVKSLRSAIGWEDPEEAIKRRDAELHAMLVGTWVADTHYKPGYRLGDGQSREVDVWTFSPDGTFNCYGADSESKFASFLMAALGLSASGKWHVHHGQLMTEVADVVNPFGNTLLKGKPHPRGTGTIKCDNKDQFWLEGVPFYRKK